MLKKFITFILIGIMCISSAGLMSGCIISDLPEKKTFTPAEDSKKITGAFKLFGKEIKLPCTVADLKSLGFETDGEFSSEGIIKMWPADAKNGSDEATYFYACTDKKITYERGDKVKDDDLIAAIKFQRDLMVDLDFNDIVFGMSDERFVETFGKPAYEFNYGPEGYGRYYEGDNGCIYRFIFGGDKTLVSILIGTPEYIDWEINYLYHS